MTKAIYATRSLPDPHGAPRWYEVTVWRNGHYRRYAVRIPGNRRPSGFISMHSYKRAARLVLMTPR